MAKVTGCFTGIKGKVGNVVYSMLNGQQIMKTRVFPYNPQSTSQQANRGRLADLVAVVKSIAATFISAVWTPTVSGAQTTWGNFISRNLNAMGASFDLTKIVPSYGSMGSLVPDLAEYNTTTGALDVDWTPIAGQPDAEDADKAGLLVTDETNKVIVFAGDASATRVDATASVTMETGLTATDLKAYLFFYRGTFAAGSVTAVSNSQGLACSAPI